MPNITPFLWFDGNAEEAVDFYLSVFPNSEVIEVTHYGDAGPGPSGSVMTINFYLDGHEFTALNGGKTGAAFDDSISFVVHCSSQEEVDRYWGALTAEGEGVAGGWLKDRFGVRWQIVPDQLMALLNDADPGRANRAMLAMMQMVKLDMATLQAAADERSD